LIFAAPQQILNKTTKTNDAVIKRCHHYLAV